jgi:hypothetical protein
VNVVPPDVIGGTPEVMPLIGCVITIVGGAVAENGLPRGGVRVVPAGIVTEAVRIWGL